MADSIWGTGSRVDDALYRAPYEFEFMQAVRLLLLEEPGKGEKDSFRVSSALRFKLDLSMAFPASAVVALKKNDAGIPEMTVALPGLLGPMRVMPDDYTELAIRQRAFGDESFAAFFDIFQHRLLALYYHAWEKQQFVLGQERAGQGRDAITSYLFDLIGMGTAGLEKRLPFSDQSLLRYAGLLAQRPRSAEALRAMLHDWLGVPVTIEQFQGRWHGLVMEEQTSLGCDGAACRLGEGAVAGDMVWNLQSLVGIVIGPLDEDKYFEFLPDGRQFQSVTALVRWYLDPVIDFRLQPVVAAGITPKWGALGCVSWGDSGAHSARLGWSSWLSDWPFSEAAGDAVFDEDEMRGKEGTRWQ